MARVRSNPSLDELVRTAVEPVVTRLAAAIAKHIAKLTSEQIEVALARGAARRGRDARVARPRARGAEMTRWVADVRARRVPKFVIELTGLDTKREIVAKYGPDAAFEKGKPAPAEAKPESKREVKAKPPIVRKSAKAAAA